jgi:hypothetical protein
MAGGWATRAHSAQCRTGSRAGLNTQHSTRAAKGSMTGADDRSLLGAPYTPGACCCLLHDKNPARLLFKPPHNPTHPCNTTGACFPHISSCLFSMSRPAKERVLYSGPQYWIAACGATCTCLKCRRAVLTNVAAWGARKRGYRLNRVRLQAILASRLTRHASQLIVRSRIALVRRGSLWALAALLAVLAPARLLRRYGRYGRLNFIEFSWEKVAYRRFSRSSELAAGAGARAYAYGVPSHAGGLPANERRGRKMDQLMQELGRLGVG